MRGYWEKQPRGPLGPFVAAYWVWEGAAPPIRHRVLPDGCIDILFSIHLDCKTDFSDLIAVGTMTRYVEVSRAEVPLLLGVRFRPAGALPFLGCPAPEITDGRLPLEDLWGEEARRLRERLEEMPTVSSRLDCLEQALLARLASVGGGDPAMTYAAARVEKNPSGSQVPDIARELGLSARQLRRRFEAAVGIGPKRFGRVVRFQRVLEAALSSRDKGNTGSTDWAGLALEAGYYDQAHLIGDFREFTGLSPTRYLSLRRRFGSLHEVDPREAPLLERAGGPGVRTGPGSSDVPFLQDAVLRSP